MNILAQSPLTKATSDPDEIPKLGKKYKVIEVIGHGGMGDVFRIQDVTTGDILAAKVLKPEFSQDTKYIERFKREANLASRLTHQNIASAYGYSETDNSLLYLVMEYVDGVNLEHVLYSCHSMHWTEALSVFKQVCTGITFAHQNKVVHRDLKPSNIMLCRTKDGYERVKILDLGISKVFSAEAEDEVEKLTQTGEIFGSPLYMSPEQCQGEEVDVRSDIYSLGCVLYEMLTGEPAFDAENSVKIIVKHINSSRDELYTVLDQCEIPEKLQEIIVKGCLSAAPKDRFNSVEELMQELENFASNPSQKVINWKPMISVAWKLLIFSGASIFAYYIALNSISFLDSMTNKDSKNPPLALPAIDTDELKPSIDNKTNQASDSDEKKSEESIQKK